MPKFKGTRKQWQIIIRALTNYADNMAFEKESVPEHWKDDTWEEIKTLYAEIQYEMEDK